MAPRAPKTLAEVAMFKLQTEQDMRPWKAARKAADICSTAVCLAIAAHHGAAGDDGGWPTQAQYATWWKITEREAQRQWADYRRVFGEDPNRVAQAILRDYSARLQKEHAQLAMSLPAELSLAV